MAKETNRFDRSSTPVDPVELALRVADALGIPLDSSERSFSALASRQLPSVDADNFRDLYLLKELVRKCPLRIEGVDTRTVALESFKNDEGNNRETNQRLIEGVGRNNYRPQVRRVFDLACIKAARTLGRFDWDLFLEGLRFGPGATTDVPRKRSDVANKIRLSTHVTSSALKLADLVFSLMPGMAYDSGVTTKCGDNGRGISCISGSALEVVDYDVMEFAEKNAKTDRIIGKGPGITVMFQLALGRAMRIALARVGVNLQDQSINQMRAQDASRIGDNATIDLKGASQSVTMGVVWQAVGNHPTVYCDRLWWWLLKTLRTAAVQLPDGSMHRYELFSAMGNGYTFELESLIFWALATCVVEELNLDPGRVTVYGDDLVVPSEAVPLLIEVFDYAGFKLNTDKSFYNTEGPHFFRESCGKHYLNGRDVTPFYVDSVLADSHSIVVLANNIIRWSTFMGVRDGRMYPVWSWVVSHLSTDFLSCRIPFGEANDGLIMDFDETCPPSAKLVNHGPGIRLTHIGYRCRTITPVRPGRRLPTHSSGDETEFYVTWLFHRSYKKHTIGKCGVSREFYHIWGINNPRGIASAVRWATTLEPVSPIDLPKIESTRGQMVLKTGKRVVRNWPLIGPWVNIDGHVLETSLLDVRAAMELRAAKRRKERSRRPTSAAT